MATFILSTGQQSSITITHISPIDIINGGIICPRPVEIICIGVEVIVLQWLRNETNIGVFTSTGFSSGNIQREEPFTLILDSITRRDNSVANMTSRLMANISTLNSGDTIACIAGSMQQDTRTLNFILRGNLYKFNYQPLCSNKIYHHYHRSALLYICPRTST